MTASSIEYVILTYRELGVGSLGNRLREILNYTDKTYLLISVGHLL